MTVTNHPDTIPNQAATKRITRGGKQAIEDKAIAEYMRVFEEYGREEAEKVFFNHFTNSKTYNNVESIKS